MCCKIKVGSNTFFFWPIVVNWNGGSLNIECLESLVAEGISEGRIVFVDNGSKDGTADVARSLGALVVHEPTPGYGAAVHAGGEAAEASAACSATAKAIPMRPARAGKTATAATARAAGVTTMTAAVAAGAAAAPAAAVAAEARAAGSATAKVTPRRPDGVGKTGARAIA